jgi:hypothetical protein
MLSDATVVEQGGRGTLCQPKDLGKKVEPVNSYSLCVLVTLS